MTVEMAHDYEDRSRIEGLIFRVSAGKASEAEESMLRRMIAAESRSLAPAQNIADVNELDRVKRDRQRIRNVLVQSGLIAAPRHKFGRVGD